MFSAFDRPGGVVKSVDFWKGELEHTPPAHSSPAREVAPTAACISSRGLSLVRQGHRLKNDQKRDAGLLLARFSARASLFSNTPLCSDATRYPGVCHATLEGPGRRPLMTRAEASTKLFSRNASVSPVLFCSRGVWLLFLQEREGIPRTKPCFARRLRSSGAVLCRPAEHLRPGRSTAGVRTPAARRHTQAGALPYKNIKTSSLAEAPIVLATTLTCAPPRLPLHHPRHPFPPARPPARALSGTNAISKRAPRRGTHHLHLPNAGQGWFVCPLPLAFAPSAC